MRMENIVWGKSRQLWELGRPTDKISRVAKVHGRNYLGKSNSNSEGICSSRRLQSGLGELGQMFGCQAIGGNAWAVALQKCSGA